MDSVAELGSGASGAPSRANQLFSGRRASRGLAHSGSDADAWTNEQQLEGTGSLSTWSRQRKPNRCYRQRGRFQNSAKLDRQHRGGAQGSLPGGNTGRAPPASWFTGVYSPPHRAFICSNTKCLLRRSLSGLLGSGAPPLLLLLVTRTLRCPCERGAQPHGTAGTGLGPRPASDCSCGQPAMDRQL